MMNATDRRCAPRRVGESSHGVRTVRLRVGHRATLVDLSASGLGIETDASVAPGTRIDVVLSAVDRSWARRALVVHSTVCGLHPSSGARYRVGARLIEDGRPMADSRTE